MDERLGAARLKQVRKHFHPIISFGGDLDRPLKVRMIGMDGALARWFTRYDEVLNSWYGTVHWSLY
jgi:hypothetical protein